MPVEALDHTNAQSKSGTSINPNPPCLRGAFCFVGGMVLCWCALSSENSKCIDCGLEFEHTGKNNMSALELEAPSLPKDEADEKAAESQRQLVRPVSIREPTVTFHEAVREIKHRMSKRWAAIHGLWSFITAVIDM